MCDGSTILEDGRQQECCMVGEQSKQQPKIRMGRLKMVEEPRKL